MPMKPPSGDAHRAELHGEEHVLAPAPLERLAEQQLVVARAVEVAGVEERDARVEAAWIVARLSARSAGP